MILFLGTVLNFFNESTKYETASFFFSYVSKGEQKLTEFSLFPYFPLFSLFHSLYIWQLGTFCAFYKEYFRIKKIHFHFFPSYVSHFSAWCSKKGTVAKKLSSFKKYGLTVWFCRINIVLRLVKKIPYYIVNVVLFKNFI